MGSGGIDHVPALRLAQVGPNAANPPVVDRDSFDNGRGHEPNSEFAALMLVGFHHASWSHVAVAWTPEHRGRMAKVHQRPPAVRLVVIDEGGFQSGFIGGAVEPAGFLGSFFSSSDF